MVQVTITRGEEVTIAFADTDGEITVAWREDRLTVTADMPDMTGREGVIYEYVFTLFQGGEDSATTWDSIADRIGGPIFDTAMFDPLEQVVDDFAESLAECTELELRCRYQVIDEEVIAILRKHPGGWYLIAYIDADGRTHLPGR